MDEAKPTAANQDACDPSLVVFLHGSGGARPDPAWIEDLARRGARIFSHWSLDGVETTRAGINDFGALCQEIGEAAPNQALLLLAPPLNPAADAFNALEALARQETSADGPAVFTAFNNSDPELNPFAALPTEALDAEGRARLVALLGSGRLLPAGDWPAELALLNPEAVRALADPDLTLAAARSRLRSLGVTPGLADWIWVETPARPANAAPRLEPHETPRPKPWGALSERLQAWLQADLDEDALAVPRLGDRPVTLHVTHSWGGGVATWVASMIDGDPDGLHLQLRSEGPQTGQGAGQRLSLYLGNQLTVPVATWWLQPAIRVVDTENVQYQRLLDDICRRYGVGRVIVSSLVGHSLDALRSGHPTLQVLHDAFPAWPLLSVHPDDFAQDLEAALADPRAQEQFPEFSLEDWQRTIATYAEAAQGVTRVAPSAAARSVQVSVEPGLDEDTISLIPHGLPPLPCAPIVPKPRSDGKLRIVIPGRVQSGKGADLLEAALPDLLEVAQVTLLGTGKGGERFFGRSGVNVILQYERESLADLLATIGPELALLPSVVPETFSYTLSEMHAFGIPVVTTAVGSFLERIKPGENGWRVAPEPGALVSQVRALADDRSGLDAVRETLSSTAPRSIEAMVADYDAQMPSKPLEPSVPVSHAQPLDVAEAQAGSLSGQLGQARALRVALESDQKKLRQQLQERTRWAEEEKRQRKTWVASLQGELEEARSERDHVLERNAAQETELAERAAHIAALGDELEQRGREIRRLEGVEAELETVQGKLQQVLASQSWKLTMPLRVSRRVATNFFVLKAWNPLRWPLLLSQTARNLSTVGLAGTLNRMQHFGPDTEAPQTEVAVEPLELPEQIELPGAVPSTETPRVSIVIPAYNHLAHTAACLSSLATTRCETPFEVIVVDDASQDETPERLADLTGLHFLRNDENLGFIGSCNRGAEAARGDFVLFLNNDTQVTDGWLDALLATFEDRPDAGLVGARLVYPDGSLQECGGIIFSDGSGWNYGRGDNPDRPEYQALREVDYCSGACIMLRRALFAELGGFDRHYAPAYYEDTDLAFKIREAGLKVYVQPRATIVHFEGVTSGTDLSSGTKRYQAVNREKFLERWADALRRQPAPIADPNDAAAVRAARDHRLHGRVLIVDAYTPEPDQDSGSVRLVNLMRCFQELGYGVTFFPDNRAWNGRYTQDLQALGVEAWYDPWLKSPEHFLEKHGPDFGLVIVSRHYVACNYLGPVRRLAPQARFVFDTVDLHYLREQRLAELEDSLTLRQVAKQTRRSELAVIRDADATLVVSPVEREILAGELPTAKVFVVSNIHEVPGSGSDFESRSDLYFVGGYQHPPNIDAAEWFVGSIWPSVRERLPGVRFHLVGSKATDAVRALGDAEGVEFHGFVESLEPFLDRCRLSVAPLRYGAGVKGKVNQAMAHGQPVVATSAAVEGLDAKDDEDALIADDAAAFADAVVRLYGDEDTWNRLSEAGIRNVERNFSTEAAQRDLKSLLDAFRD